MVVRARLFCSDPGCDTVYEAVGPLGDIETLACGCGWGLELLGLPERLESRSGRFRRVELRVLVG